MGACWTARPKPYRAARAATCVRAWLVLLLIPLAGCVDEGPVDAQAGYDAAVARALQWDSTARLMGVLGGEGPSSGTGWVAQMGGDDAILGDGLAPRWLYVFLGTDPEPLYVITEGASVVFVDTMSKEEALLGDALELGRVPLVKEDLDSRAAARVVSGMTEGPVSWNVLRGLEEDEEHSEPEEDGAIWLVHSDAEPVAVQDGRVVPFPVLDEDVFGGHAQGVLGVGESTTHTFEVDVDEFAMTLRLDPALPLDIARLTVIDPAGAETGAVLDAGPTGDGSAVTLRFDDPLKGEWTFTVAAERGARVSWFVDWSAPQE